MKFYSLKTASPLSTQDAESIIGSNGGTILRLDSDGKSSTVYFGAAEAAHAKNAETAMSAKSKSTLKEVTEKEVTTLK